MSVDFITNQLTAFKKTIDQQSTDICLLLTYALIPSITGLAEQVAFTGYSRWARDRADRVGQGIITEVKQILSSCNTWQWSKFLLGDFLESIVRLIHISMRIVNHLRATDFIFYLTMVLSGDSFVYTVERR